MASVMRLAIGRLSSTLNLAATSLSPRPVLPLLSAPRPTTITTNPPLLRQYSITTPSLLQPSSANHSLLLSSSSLSPSSPVLTTSLLQTINKFLPVQSCRSYHVRVSLKKRCSGCYFVRRKGRLFMECKTKPRHKTMQVMSKRKTWKEDYSEGFVRGAVYWNYRRDSHYYKLGDTPFARHDWLKGKIGVTV